MKLVDILARELKVWPEGCDELFQTSSGRVIGVSNRDTEKSEKIGAFMLNDEGVYPHVTRAEWQAAVDALNAPKVLEWPEGATHKFSEPTTSPWRDLSGATWKWFESGIWRDSGRTSESLMAKQPHRLTKLPIPENEISMPDLVVKWDGVGDPPVGTVCEYDARPSGKGEPLFVTVEVKYVSYQSIVIICTDVPDGEKKENIGVELALMNGLSMLGKLRPIRTAEQVAAEEREKAIEEMVFGVCGCEPDGGNTSAFMMCGFLYDAGYRKQ